MIREQPLDGADELDVEQVGRRQVHRDGERDALLTPAPDLFQRHAQGAVGDLAHQSGALGDGQDLFRQQRSAGGVLPAQHRLDAVNAAVAPVDLGLVVQFQFVGVEQCGTQVLDEVGVVVPINLERRVVDRDLAAGGFGVRHRGLGAAQQLLRVVAVVGTQRDGDAAFDLDGDRIQRDRLTQRFQQPARLSAGGGQVGPVREQHGELVITDPRQHVVATDAAGQAVCDVAQQLIAEVATDRVGDLVKIAQAQQQQRPPRARSARNRRRPRRRSGQRGQGAGQRVPVGQRGQLVGHGVLGVRVQQAHVPEGQRESRGRHDQAQRRQGRRRPRMMRQDDDSQRDNRRRHRGDIRAESVSGHWRRRRRGGPAGHRDEQRRRRPAGIQQGADPIGARRRLEQVRHVRHRKHDQSGHQQHPAKVVAPAEYWQHAGGQGQEHQVNPGVDQSHPHRRGRA